MRSRLTAFAAAAALAAGLFVKGQWDDAARAAAAAARAASHDDSVIAAGTKLIDDIVSYVQKNPGTALEYSEKVISSRKDIRTVAAAVYRISSTAVDGALPLARAKHTVVVVPTVSTIVDEAANAQATSLTEAERTAARQLVKQAACMGLKANFPKETKSSLLFPPKEKTPREQIEEFVVDQLKSRVRKLQPQSRQIAFKVEKLVNDVNDQTTTSRAVYVGVVELTCEVVN